MAAPLFREQVEGVRVSPDGSAIFAFAIVDAPGGDPHQSEMAMKLFKHSRLRLLPAFLCLGAATLQCSMLAQRWYYEPAESSAADDAGEYPAAVLARGAYTVTARAVAARFKLERYGPCLLPLFGSVSPAPEFRRRLNLVLTFRGSPDGRPMQIRPYEFLVRAKQGVFAPTSFQILDDGGRVSSSSWGSAYYNRKEFFFGPGRIRLYYKLDTSKTSAFELEPAGIKTSPKTTVRFNYERDWRYTPFTLKPLRSIGGPVH